MMSYDKASPNAKIGCSNSNDPEFLEKLVREGKTNREIALILDLDYGSVASILYRYGIKRDPNRPCKRCGGPIGSTNTRQLYCKDCKYLVNATVNSNGFLICNAIDMEIAPEDFCSYGERRAEKEPPEEGET